jgi:hypothetical protein
MSEIPTGCKAVIEDILMNKLNNWVVLSYGKWYDLYTISTKITWLLTKCHLINPRINYKER